MTSSLSAKENIGVPIFSPRKFRRKAFSVSGKTLVVIHPELVKSLGINESTWFEEIETDRGILLAICNLSEQGTTMNTRDDDVEHQKSY
jgi:hypothetical protein